MRCIVATQYLDGVQTHSLVVAPHQALARDRVRRRPGRRLLYTFRHEMWRTRGPVHSPPPRVLALSCLLCTGRNEHRTDLHTSFARDENFRAERCQRIQRQGETSCAMREKLRRRHDADVRASSMRSDHGDIFDITSGGQKPRIAFAAYVKKVSRLFALQERSIEDRRAATEHTRLCRKLRCAMRQRPSSWSASS